MTPMTKATRRNRVSNRSSVSWATGFAVLLICVGTSAAELEVEPGFTSMFDGKSLEGWSAMPSDAAKQWSVKDGMIVGQGGEERSYLVYANREIADFELKLSYRFPGKGNSGISTRAREDETGTRLLSR